MGNIGPTEVLIAGMIVVSTYAIVFVFGFFIGKGVGFRQGIREQRR